LINEKRLNAIERVPLGRINFGICTIRNEFVIVVGGNNSNNEYIINYFMIILNCIAYIYVFLTKN
jgi:hypothetical protein